MANGVENSDQDTVVSSRAVSCVNSGLRAISELRIRQDPAHIQQLNLHGNEIEHTRGIERFTGLLELCLSSNRISQIANISFEKLTYLRVLDLSANNIRSIAGFPVLPSLRELSLAHNCVNSVQELFSPVIRFPQLRYLDLRNNSINDIKELEGLKQLEHLTQLRLQAKDNSQANPVCASIEYPSRVIQSVPCLEWIDEEEVAFLKEVGALQMPKYHALMRKFTREEKSQSRESPPKSVPPKEPVRKPIRSVMKQPGKKKVVPASAPLQVFIESEERRGYQWLDNREEEAEEIDQEPEKEENEPAKVSVEHTKENNCKNRGGDSSSSSFSTSPECKEPDKATKRSSSTETHPIHSSKEPIQPPPVIERTIQRVIVRDDATNTSNEYENELKVRENTLLSQEKVLFDKEKHFFESEKQFEASSKHLQSQIEVLESQLESVHARAVKAEALIVDLSSELVQLKRKTHQDDEEKESAQALDASSFPTKSQCEARALAEAHCQELERQKGQFEQQNNQLKADCARQQKEIGIFFNEIQQLKANAEVVEKQRESFRIESERRQNEKDALSKQLLALSKRHHQLQDESEKRIQDLRESLDRKIHEKEQEITYLQRELTAKSNELDHFQAQVRQDQARQAVFRQQEQEFHQQKLATSLNQMEMEFRKEHQAFVDKFAHFTSRHQEAIKELQRQERALEASQKREKQMKQRVKELQTTLSAGQKSQFRVNDSELDDLKSQFVSLKASEAVLLQFKQEKTQECTELRHLCDSLTTSKQELEAKTQQLEEKLGRCAQALEMAQTSQQDALSAVKVKNVMLEDQQRQIQELKKAKKELEKTGDEELQELQAQIQDLEAALDEQIVKNQEEIDRREQVESQFGSYEATRQENERLQQQLHDLHEELQQKDATMDVLESEMTKMRQVLTQQEALVQKKVQLHVAKHEEELEMCHKVMEMKQKQYEDDLKHWRQQWELKETALEHQKSQCQQEKQAVEQQLAWERHQLRQNEGEMKVLLAQIDRERQLKKQSIRQISALFQQLQESK